MRRCDAQRDDASRTTPIAAVDVHRAEARESAPTKPESWSPVTAYAGNSLLTPSAASHTRRNVESSINRRCRRRRHHPSNQILRPSLVLACLLPEMACGFAFCARAPLAVPSVRAAGDCCGGRLSIGSAPCAAAPAATQTSHPVPPSTMTHLEGFPFAARVRRLLPWTVDRPSALPSSSWPSAAASLALASTTAEPGAVRNRGRSGIVRGTVVEMNPSSASTSALAASTRCAGAEELDSTAITANDNIDSERANSRQFPAAMNFWRKRSSAFRHSGVARAAIRAGAAVVSRPLNLRRHRRAAGAVLISALAFVAMYQPAVAAVLGRAVAERGRPFLAMMPAAAVAGGSSGGAAAGSKMPLEVVAPKLALWFALFVTSAGFHSAEIAITTLYPWKVKEFAEEEGDNSPFQVLNKDITRVLTTILVATTVCTIYNAALFTNLAIQMFGSAGLAYATAALTVTTLFFGELLPKALGVNNAEVVARRILPVIIVLSWVLNPIAKSFTILSKLMLSLLGFKSTETGRVSEEELRLIVTGAKQSGGIESEEGMMIEGVLDLQDTKIHEIMRPRVEVIAIEANSTMMDLYALHQDTKYSRIPVYSGEIDRISGVVLSKDLLEFVQDPAKLSSILVADVMESTYFVPETMSVWNVLEEMRRRRLHMAIVVDEYGGTAGVVTLEDILEEVVGEIYDEKEDEEFREEEHYINVNEDGSFTIHGMADLEDVCTSLAFQQVDEDDLKEFGTLSGYLCSQAGEIPAAGDYLMVGGYMFTITKADERRIEEVHARLIGTTDVQDTTGNQPGKTGGGGGGAEGGGNRGKQKDEGAASSSNGDRPPWTPPSPGSGSAAR